MKSIPVIYALALSVIATGCATKNYVRKSIDPVNGQLNEQRAALGQTSDSLKKTQQTLEEDETVLSATKERATAADARAGDALNRAGEAATKATEASGKADQAIQQTAEVGRNVGDLKSQMASMDDYKRVSTATINFAFNSNTLTSDAKMQLDEIAQGSNKYKRYFMVVEGFTDKTGSDSYNAALSRRRADAVVAYLVSQHDIPVYRIQMVGLGQAKPVDEGKDRTARAKNRRVEVSIYSADSGSASQPATNK